MSKRNIRVAAVSMDCILGNPMANVKKIRKAVQIASTKGTDVIAFPELATTGYALPLDGFHNVAEPIPGPTTKILEKEARENDVYLLVGMAEMPEHKQEFNGAIYDSAILVGPEGLVGKCRKIHLFNKEKKIFKPGTEEDLKVFRTNIGTFGVAVCYDFEFPEFPRILALRGAEVIFHLSANMSPYEERHDIRARARAIENSIFVVNANRVGKEKRNNFFGRSQIIGPNGEILAWTGANENIIFATLDMNELRKQRRLIPYFRDRKPEIYSLLCIAK